MSFMDGLLFGMGALLGVAIMAFVINGTMALLTWCAESVGYALANRKARSRTRDMLQRRDAERRRAD